MNLNLGMNFYAGGGSKTVNNSSQICSQFLNLTGNERAKVEAVESRTTTALVACFLNKRRHVGTHENHKIFNELSVQIVTKKSSHPKVATFLLQFQLLNFFFINLTGEVIDFISQLAQFYIRHSLLILDFFQNFCALRHA